MKRLLESNSPWPSLSLVGSIRAVSILMISGGIHVTGEMFAMRTILGFRRSVEAAYRRIKNSVNLWQAGLPLGGFDNR